ncbi:TIGR01777 family oxidoreductase [Nocardia sp. 2]|uniref:TIGR01777 family oxidoreductase n=1 Tax=Nocardia acididurans TaxID=2802282 RepID=A0ABS1M772_9NOCA|nr:TIGR01777 family oxidoreductase [Nocardia acididurans]MBL1076406.1 TIGR01777 family oxidoreductase [Nocardia acididurans]
MSFEYSSVVDAPREEVFAWFSRPGALPRLAPPWQPVRIEAESGSLADGTAVLGLPGGLRWVAEHQPERYDAPGRFADHIGGRGLASLPLRTLMRWNHLHDFEAVDAGHTRVIDRVDTPVPAALLRPMFVYRHRQLADDLRAHRTAAAQGFGPLTVAITGASGLVGTALSAFLSTGGHRVIRLVRHAPRHADERRWAPDDPDPALLDGVDAVVHLAGASIAGRFTDAHRREIRDSRIGPTRALAELIAKDAGTPRILVCASAIGYYGADRGDELLDETSARGDGFLAEVVADWENATEPAAAAGARVVTVRTGLVQSPSGGTLRLLRPLFTAGLGGKLGSGRQWQSWIGIDDLIDTYHRALWDTELAGPVNAVAPNPMTNAEYTRVLADVLNRPAVLPVPSFGPRLLLGSEGVRELALASQRVLPGRLLDARHHFRHPTLDAALRHVLGRARD